MDFKIDGNVPALLMSIILGVVILFIGLFTLATIDPMFAGRVYDCVNTNAAGSGALTLNGSGGAGETDGIQTFSITNRRGGCDLYVNITNVTAAPGGGVLVRNNGTGTLLQNITVPENSTLTAITGAASAASGTLTINYTHSGSNNVTILASATTGSYLRCCTSLTPQAGPAGQTYPGLIVTIATIFTVFGLILIVIGLAAAIGSLKNMF